ncbi:MAG: thiamine biosynthesis protein [Desulfobulbus propionicus]|nr:MAG: thiamine biosynthesis protein [Desulfobulbus propionicus]
MNTVALGLFSGGLDSILACRLLVQQGITVVCLKFVTPFIDYNLLERQEEYIAAMKNRFALDVVVVDISKGYLEMLHNPAYGFGKNFNPCIDCKILMLRQARKLMARYNASFLVTGEVLGQRPMSQRRDTIRVIERDAGCEGIILRPLSARILPATNAEKEGKVDRLQLCSISGRGRKKQIQLAKELGIRDYPKPGGGCILTDKQLGRRIERVYSGEILLGTRKLSPADIKLLIIGRQFLLLEKYWFILGRNEKENDQLNAARQKDDWLFSMPSHPGPAGLLRRAKEIKDRQTQEAVAAAAAGLVARFAKKIDGHFPAGKILIDKGDTSCSRMTDALTDEVFSSWKIA